MATDFDPSNVDLNTADPAQVVCYLKAGGNEYNGHMGARISAIFVILICSTLATLFPVIARRSPRLKIPVYVYLFARYFGTGVILATAFVHLLDPAYDEIGPDSCVGMTGGWAEYSWPPAIVLASITVIFLMDFGAELYVESKYGEHDHSLPENVNDTATASNNKLENNNNTTTIKAWDTLSDMDSVTAEKSFKQQIAAFLILEFGVIFHSVIIGLNLGVAGDEFSTLYPVLVFHQSFEGLGIGARMSAIPFKRSSWLPWIFSAVYGLTTPIAIAIGLGLRKTYNPGSNTANIVSGVFDSISAGILIYTALVELLARDFLFDPCRTNDRRRLAFMVITTILGTGVMALLGKWA
ncbi:high affinity zinc ion transporter, putative [Talaromyces stipitatus ATCC 10500]|uniref:High affinity zinc ion transporter, putative n=1 Tax=Talaromyces stipitatus (strain ATCC 10500 / CBS 375.48 / QM 6759 / NRRL 1006) TaxID=441959 RepID=B8M113_TALSN|nr:high affinity zinc ion transporter, putative [Talaromyces stipitatus ATCC 10500]EED21793.1 high affinity zinc ion transporter, putative [Talaromyces stipitatus ATCC 10500]